MKYDGFSIQKYVGVTPTKFAKLHKVITTLLCKKLPWIQGTGYVWNVYAEIKTVSWNTDHKSLTVEVIVYEYARKFQGSSEDSMKPAGHNQYAPTERWMITKILNALGCFKTQPK